MGINNYKIRYTYIRRKKHSNSCYFIIAWHISSESDSDYSDVGELEQCKEEEPIARVQWFDGIVFSNYNIFYMEIQPPPNL